MDTEPDEMPFDVAVGIADSVDDARLEQALRVIRAEELKDVDEKYEKYSSRDDYLAELERLGDAFLRRNEFTPGQIVKWKEGLKNRRRPGIGKPAVVVEYLDQPVLFERSRDETAVAENFDLRLGFHIEDGRFVVFHFDSRRFEPFGH